MNRLGDIMLGCALLGLTGCAAVGQFSARMEAGEGDSGVTNDRRLGRSPWGVALLYPVNRVFDLCDVARFGVNVGPGLGVDAQASDLLRVAAIQDTSVGVGFQGLRRLPVCARSRTDLAFGPARTPPISPLGWHGQFWDVGAEAYVLLVGAHAYVNPKEIVDFFAGWALRDPMGDDWETAF
ncbi:MAG: hypothetical protein NTW86_18185 [Candidatus Sumerlaeota bacterium]|nr:hypothetical protein [Candidatus Sumerlaeota bacterium]